MGHEPPANDETATDQTDDWFDRELADVHAQLDAIAAWLKTRPRTPVPLPPWQPSAHLVAGDNAEPTAPIGRGLAASAQAEESAEPGSGGRLDRHPAGDAASGGAPAAERSPTTSAAAPAPAAPSPSSTTAPASPPLPTGTDLADPKNFGMMPPVAELEQGNTPAEEYRQRLGKHLAFATTVLHTSKVPAAVWREWRAFEKSIHERLLALTAPAKPET